MTETQAELNWRKEREREGFRDDLTPRRQPGVWAPPECYIPFWLIQPYEGCEAPRFAPEP